MKNKKTVILGLNGWMDRGHDASACLVIGDKIVAFAEEERFDRSRYGYNLLPVRSAAYCLTKGSVELREVDKVVYGWDMPKLYSSRFGKFPYKNSDLSRLIFPEELYQYDKPPKIHFIDHHIAHAASSYRLSGFKNSMVIVLDGQGENSSGTLAFAEDGELTYLKHTPISYSLGYMMEAACKHIGLSTSSVGKLMGLAGHGKRGKIFNNIELKKLGYSIKEFPRDEEIIGGTVGEQSQVIKVWRDYFDKEFSFSISTREIFNKTEGILKKSVKFKQIHRDFALSAQKTLEEIIVHLVKEMIKETGCRNLSFSGGVALNCTTNGRLISENIVDDLFIQPAANDAGVSIGAALETAYKLNKTRFNQENVVYLGPEYGDSEIKNVLDHLKISYKKVKNIHKRAAEALSNGKVVAWFQGRMEGGPRALGNRSILANPKLKEMHDIVNEIKSRENWRPLSPSILEEHREEFFENSSYSPYMLQTHKVRDEKEESIQAVVHKDMTSRYQSVTRESNPGYYKLIKEFYKQTGIPVVMNTSFNIGGEPLVCTPKDALKTFYLSAIDYLALGNYWITKGENDK